MWAKDKQTLDFLQRMGPTFHLGLYHHHQLASKANNVEEPKDEETVIFDYPDGSQYSITYGKLKQFAKEEQEKFIKENDDKFSDTEGTE
jgi:hypothetical protein